MVEKKSRITRKPALQPEAIEEFLEQLGTDPESALATSTSTATPPTLPQEDDTKGKAFPHRLSADFSAEQYKRLKRAGFETDQPMTTIVREAVEDWLKARGY